MDLPIPKFDWIIVLKGVKNLSPEGSMHVKLIHFSPIQNRKRCNLDASPCVLKYLTRPQFTISVTYYIDKTAILEIIVANDKIMMIKLYVYKQ